MIIRLARHEDRAPIARLHAESWRTAYRGVIADAYLDGPIFAAFADRWANQPVTEDDALLVVQGPDGALLGFGATWRQGDVAYIDNLHVAPEARSRGAGRALLAETAARMAAYGCTSAYLHVVTSNARARDLYLRLGGQPGAVTLHDLGGTMVPNQRIDWPEIAVLARGL